MRYVIQENDEFNAPEFESLKSDYVQFGELIEKYPLMEPYNTGQDKRCREFVSHTRMILKIFKRYDMTIMKLLHIIIHKTVHS